jgi:arylsulfatase A-like enzyme
MSISDAIGTRWCGAVVLIALLPLPAPAAVPRSKPNFLFLLTDDQRYDALGVVQREQGAKARFPWFQTPNLDRLAAEGVRFRNAFVVSSLCSPSRAAFLTGRYNHFNGVANNATPFPLQNVTHATLLRQAGYSTGYIGKWHMRRQSGQRPGCDYSASYIGHARYFDAVFEINGVATATTGWVDDVATNYAIDFVRENKDKNWSLVVGFKSPHGPFSPPPRLKDRFAGCQARWAPNLQVTAPFPGVTRPVLPPFDGRGTPPAVDVDLNYFRCIAGADENVGRLLDTLDKLGLTDDTLVIYASDNGLYEGEHNLTDKRSAYEESIRIPLLIRYPRLIQRGVARDEMVLNVDLAPMLLDFAGVLAPPDLQGQSWRPLLEGRTVPWRRAWFYEYFWERQPGNSTPNHTAVRTETAKLIKYRGHEEWNELFDLKNDPYEVHNLYASPGHASLRSDMDAEHARLLKDVGYRIPPYAQQPNKPGVGKATKKKKK